ncbi:Ribosomal protein S6--L-glutamate ligase [bioreactor metagenome]|uniref:Ribosomal protein S6--L-glutamate ligase n=1 Tax=bioreactor metagenome TaxID=1076179 RepID=A0A645IWI3_9ZZZZ
MTPEIEQLAIETAFTFGLDIAGIDLLFDGDNFKVCEANSSPGFEGLEECCGINVAEIIYDFIREKVREK